MAIYYLNKYFYADEYTIIGGLATFTLKGSRVLTAPVEEIKVFNWSLT